MMTEREPQSATPREEPGPPEAGQRTPQIELQAPTEREEEVKITVPKKLAEDILPTVRYLFRSDKEGAKETPQEEYQRFIARRNSDETAKLLDPGRVKRGWEKREIERLVQEQMNQQRLTEKEAYNKLMQEHIYAPLRVQRYWRLMGSLSTEKPTDISFLEQKLRSRREHEYGMLRGESPNWRGPEPPTGKQKKEFTQEGDKMDGFLKQLDRVKRGEYRE